MEAGLIDDLASENLTKEQLFTILLPYYLSIGMSRDEFYNGDPALVKAYFRAELIRSRREEAALWRSGIYINQAVAQVLHGAQKCQYFERPLPVTQSEAEALEQERQKKEMEKEKAAFAAFVNGWKKKQGGQS